MKSLLWSLILWLLLLSPTSGKMKVFFPPDDNCTKEISDSILSATNSVLVMAYNFTDQQIAAALVDRSKHHLQVIILVDKLALLQKGCQAKFCQEGGCDVRSHGHHKIAHDKVIVIDFNPDPKLTFQTARSIVFTGSFNYSFNAQHSNAENLLKIYPELTKEEYSVQRQYYEDWQHHYLHTDLYQPEPTSTGHLLPAKKKSPGSIPRTHQKHKSKGRDRAANANGNPPEHQGGLPGVLPPAKPMPDPRNFPSIVTENLVVTPLK